MIEVLKNKYWSKSEAFLLPLTGLAKSQQYKLDSYLFWENYSIEDYFLIIKFTYDNYDNFVEHCRRTIFPILDKGGYAIESYDFGNQSVMVLNMDMWAKDIELFLQGKYSRFSDVAKKVITEYHTFYDRGNKIYIHIKSSLFPDVPLGALGDLTPIEYVAENYGLPLDELRKGGELGGIYNKELETLKGLILDENQLRKEGSALG